MQESEIPIISPQTLGQLTSKKEGVRKVAEAEIEKLGDQKFEALLTAIAKEGEKRRKTQRCTRNTAIFMGSLMGLIVLGAVVRGVATHNWSFFSDWSSFFCMFGVVGSSVGLTQSHKNAARLLTEFDDLRAVGPLLEIREGEDSALKKLAEQSLMRLLPRMKASDASLLDEAQMGSLARALKSKDTDFVCTVLKAMEQIGDEKSLEEVRKWARIETPNPMNARICEAARECEPYLQRRVEDTKLAKTLLRPSQAEASPDMLLRPVEYRPDSNTNELLRPEVEPNTQLNTLKRVEQPQEEQKIQQTLSS